MSDSPVFKKVAIVGVGAIGGLFASWLGLSGIPREAEIIPLERDLRLATLTGAKYHAAKISVPESVEAIKLARSRGACIVLSPDDQA